MREIALVCPSCRGALVRDGARLTCARGHVWRADGGIADFAAGAYYDSFDETTELRAEHRAGLELEYDGTRRRILDYYLPLIAAAGVTSPRVLDCGCGNGLSVDLLRERGIDAWGNDLSALRKWQWRERREKERLVVASALSLPFENGAFDVVISSGVIEHIGVDETAVPRYTVRARADRDEARLAFFAELGRVTRAGGLLFIDCPNRLFPIDFWHADAPGRPRFHSPFEPFLPSFGELRALVRRAIPGARVEPLSPWKRLQFFQASRYWYGRLLGPAAGAMFRLMQTRALRFLAATAVNPFLVAKIETPPVSERR